MLLPNHLIEQIIWHGEAQHLLQIDIDPDFFFSKAKSREVVRKFKRTNVFLRM